MKKINLALQGGGSHGAYQWGILDALMSSGKVEIEGISGCSAGSMNAAVLASGLALGGPDAAIESLAKFWNKIGEMGHSASYKVMPWERMMYGWNLAKSPVFKLQHSIMSLFSPYQSNPFNFHPLRDVINATVDFDALNSDRAPKIYISATNVRSGQVKIFERGEITTDVLLASACLPTVFQAVEIDGEHYWDGGFAGNPSLWPLIYGTDTHDILIVEINPLYRDSVPHTMLEINDRVNEITFNSGLIAELRAIKFAAKLVEKQRVGASEYKKLRLHMVEVSSFLDGLGASSKMNAEPAFLTALRASGVEQGHRWLQVDYPAVGIHSTLDIEGKYLRPSTEITKPVGQAKAA